MVAVPLPSSAKPQASNEDGDIHLLLSLSTIGLEEDVTLYLLNLHSVLRLKFLDISCHVEYF